VLAEMGHAAAMARSDAPADFILTISLNFLMGSLGDRSLPSAVHFLAAQLKLRDPPIGLLRNR
jgi:hypothetical protein